MSAAATPDPAAGAARREPPPTTGPAASAATSSTPAPPAPPPAEVVPLASELPASPAAAHASPAVHEAVHASPASPASLVAANASPSASVPLALAPAPRDAAATARATMAVGSRSFSLAARLLPADSRDDAAVVYTYCRRADDAIDDAPARPAAEAALARLRAELDAVYTGSGAVPDAHPAATSPAPPAAATGDAGPLADPVLARFAEIARARRLPRHYPEELLAGMEMDVVGTRYDSVDDLLCYAYRVAGVVGLMMCHVMGVRDDDALVPAVHLGIAMQLTNVCRDVAEDWRRRRLYLPAELLARHGGASLAELAAAGAPLPDSARAPLAAVTGELLRLADRYYRSADRGVPALGWRPALGVRAARRLYAAIGRRVERAGCDPLAPRAVVPRWWQLTLLGRAALGALAEVPRRARQLGPRRPPTTTLELRHVPRLV